MILFDKHSTNSRRHHMRTCVIGRSRTHDHLPTSFPLLQILNCSNTPRVTRCCWAVSEKTKRNAVFPWVFLVFCLRLPLFVTSSGCHLNGTFFPFLEPFIPRLRNGVDFVLLFSVLLWLVDSVRPFIFTWGQWIHLFSLNCLPNSTTYWSSS